METAERDHMYDVGIIGGGSAGLSAALNLARARRSVAIVDGGQPRNAPAAAAHGLLGLEGIGPLELLEKGRSEVASYGARTVHASVQHASGSAQDGFTLELDDGARVLAEQLIIATGVHDDLPAIEGLAERWGRDVVHCPYCHGWEIQDQRIGLLATGPMSAMQAMMFRQWTDEMWFFPNGREFPAEQLAKLRALGVTIIEGTASGIEIADDHLRAVLVNEGTRVGLDALAVPSMTRPRLEGLEELGLEVDENSMGVFVVADAAGHTSVPGVWAAGNVVNAGLQVSEAAANGARVGITLNTERVFAQAEQALEAYSLESE